ncbi:MAG: hypothetical protein DYG96_01380 [Chlorobi bacterium CHB2]|nr:hypothetical protein [Chlorobi bacterium CHB2]
MRTNRNHNTPGRPIALTLLILAALLCCFTPTFAQTNNCFTDTIRVNTGWNHATNSLDPVGAQTAYWTVVSDPSASTTEPRPASVITKYSSWCNPLANSQWLSSYPSASNDANGTYIFDDTLCISPEVQKAQVHLELYVDDYARVYFNGVQIGASVPSYGFLCGNKATINVSVPITTYKNVLRVEVLNTSSVAMGFDLSGYITAPGFSVGLTNPKCCVEKGSIIGTKFLDKNCNGKWDAGEQGLPGWTITATNGTNTYTAVTDVFGNYYLNGLPPGSYTVSEIQQLGYTQTYPVPNNYTITVANGQVVNHIDFGNCRKQTEPCFQIVEQQVKCTTIQGGLIPAYSWSFYIRSLRNCSATQSASVSVVSPAGVSFFPGSFSVTNSFTPQSLTLHGPGAVAGATVTFAIKICCPSADGTVQCCEDTISIKLPECPPQRCAIVEADSVKCITDPATGTQQYVAWMTVTNLGIAPNAEWLTLNASGVTFVPNPVNLSALPIGGSTSVVVNFTGATPGPLTIYATLCDKTRQYCCRDSFQIKVPQCEIPIPDCCNEFQKKFWRLSSSASANGFATINGFLAAGPAPIVKVSATLVDARINGVPVVGQFINPGNHINFVGGTIPFMHEFLWVNSPYTNLGVPTPFQFRLRFPAKPWYQRRDVISYCVRVRYTDINCVTCDTVICFKRTRYGWIIADPTLTHGLSNQKSSSSFLGSNQPTVAGQLTGDNSGSLNINFPQAPAELGGITYTGISISANDLTISSATETERSIVGTQEFDGTQRFNFVATPGQTAAFAMDYANLNGATSAPHRVTFHYVLADSPEDTLQEEIDLTLRRGQLSGGDVVESASVGLSDLKTYAIHLTNANGSKEPIARVVIESVEGAEIVAVGPTANPTHATLSFGTNDGRNFVAETMTSGEELASGQSHKPIYLTLANVAEGATIRFTTYNADGAVISNGELSLQGGATSGIEATGDDAHTTLLRTAYPNPTSGEATIEFALPRSADNVTMVLSDAAGREISRPINNQNLSAGTHVVGLDLSDLPSGTYRYTLRVGATIETGAVQVVK